MELETFELERFQSIWEHEVEINLTESGVEPYKVEDLISDDNLRDRFLSTKLGYPQTNGDLELRQLISNLYEGVEPKQVVVTNGGAEANFTAIWNLILEDKARREIVVMLPNYMQIPGLVKAFGGIVRPFRLQLTDGKWTPDLEKLKHLVSNKTSAIVICNPNNPTGSCLKNEDMKSIAEITNDKGAWLLSDEVYQGAEHGEQSTPSAYSYSDHVIVTNSLSKAYGLPGLRIGWIVSSNQDKSEELWAYSDYTTICSTILSNFLARIALEPETRKQIINRTRRIVSEHWGVMKNWLDEHEEIFEYAPPEAASICFPKHNLTVSSLEFVQHLLKEKSVLLIPGEYFGFQNYFRFGFGYGVDKLKVGLERVGELIASIVS